MGASCSGGYSGRVLFGGLLFGIYISNILFVGEEVFFQLFYAATVIGIDRRASV